MSSPTKIARPDSLVFRLTIVYAALSTLALVAVLSISYVILARQLDADLKRELQSEVVEIGAVLESHGLPVLKELAQQEEQAEGRGRSYFRIFTKDGQETFQTDMSEWSDVAVNRSAVERAAAGRQELVKIDAGSRRYPAFVLYSPMGSDYVVEFGLLADDEGIVLRNYRGAFVVSSLIFVVLSFLLGSFIAHRALGGVQNVTETVRRIAAGAWDSRVPVGKRRDEVANLADAFNNMIERIQKLIAELRDVTDDIAHDLRTPVARIRATAESCLDSPEASQDMQELAGNVLEECDRLLLLINTMLEISQMDAGAKQFASEPVDVAELTEDVFELFRPAAEDKGIRMKLDVGAPQIAHGDRHCLMRAIAHVVDNAVKYTESGGDISVGCAPRNGSIVVSVSDTGVGIEESDIPRVFDRFYRADRSRAGSGHGLGLSASRAICSAHGGTVSVSSATGKGSTFEIAIPAG